MDKKNTLSVYIVQLTGIHTIFLARIATAHLQLQWESRHSSSVVWTTVRQGIDWFRNYNYDIMWLIKTITMRE